MKKRHSAEQIVAMLRDADVLLGQGLKVPQASKQLGVLVRATLAGTLLESHTAGRLGTVISGPVIHVLNGEGKGNRPLAMTNEEIGAVQKHELLGGLLNHYERKAA